MEAARDRANGGHESGELVDKSSSGPRSELEADLHLLLEHGVSVSTAAKVLKGEFAQVRQLAQQWVATHGGAQFTTEVGEEVLGRSDSCLQDARFVEALIGSFSTEVPEELLDPVSLSVIKDPVVLSSGVCMDRASAFTPEGTLRFPNCPLTRQPLLPKAYPVNVLKNRGKDLLRGNLAKVCQLAEGLEEAGQSEEARRAADIAREFVEEIGETVYHREALRVHALRQRQLAPDDAAGHGAICMKVVSIFAGSGAPLEGLLEFLQSTFPLGTPLEGEKEEEGAAGAAGELAVTARARRELRAGREGAARAWSAAGHWVARALLHLLCDKWTQPRLAEAVVEQARLALHIARAAAPPPPEAEDSGGDSGAAQARDDDVADDKGGDAAAGEEAEARLSEVDACEVSLALLLKTLQEDAVYTHPLVREYAEAVDAAEGLSSRPGLQQRCENILVPPQTGGPRGLVERVEARVEEGSGRVLGLSFRLRDGLPPQHAGDPSAGTALPPILLDPREHITRVSVAPPVRRPSDGQPLRPLPILAIALHTMGPSGALSRDLLGSLQDHPDSASFEAAEGMQIVGLASPLELRLGPSDDSDDESESDELVICAAVQRPLEQSLQKPRPFAGVWAMHINDPDPDSDEPHVMYCEMRDRNIAGRTVVRVSFGGHLFDDDDDSDEDEESRVLILGHTMSWLHSQRRCGLQLGLLSPDGNSITCDPPDFFEAGAISEAVTFTRGEYEELRAIGVPEDHAIMQCCDRREKKEKTPAMWERAMLLATPGEDLVADLPTLFDGLRAQHEGRQTA